MKINVEIHRDEKGRPSILDVKRGRRKLRAEVMETDQDGYTSKVVLSGSRDAMPTFGDVLSRFFDGHLARIGTIELVDLITEITTIQTIAEITNVVALPSRTVTDLGILHGEDSTLFSETNAAYQLQATLLFHTLSLKNVNEIHLNWKRAGGLAAYGLKITSEIDQSGSETTLFEKTTGCPVAFTWLVENSFTAVEGDIIEIHLYLKADGANAIDVTDFQVYGDHEKETHA